MKTTTVTPSRPDPRWTLLVTRRASGRLPFYYAVKTTGIFCKPGCRSRLPKPGNVSFFDSAGDALAAGFRPCKRCQPGGPSWTEQIKEKVLQACRRLQESSETVSVPTLAAKANLSESHFRRLFKLHVGVSPKQYEQGCRLKRFKSELRLASGVTPAIYNSGFGSSSRAYEKVTSKLGMSPRQLQKRGDGESILFDVRKTRLGWILVAASTRGVCAVELGDSHQALLKNLKTAFSKAKIQRDSDKIAPIVGKVLGLVEETGSASDLPLDVRGTAFQHLVWKALQDIPRGETRSYQALAQAIGRPEGVRAVAGACAANKLALLIPCHRAVRSGGGLGGYRWGLKRKHFVLAIERQKPNC